MDFERAKSRRYGNSMYKLEFLKSARKFTVGLSMADNICLDNFFPTQHGIWFFECRCNARAFQCLQNLNGDLASIKNRPEERQNWIAPSSIRHCIPFLRGIFIFINTAVGAIKNFVVMAAIASSEYIKLKH